MKNYIAFLSVIFLAVSCSDPVSTDNGGEDNEYMPQDTLPNDTIGISDRGSNSLDQVHTLWGTPVDLTPDNDNIFQREQYIFSYNPDRNVTNWVAWEISNEWYGDEPRFEGRFKTDPLLSDEWYKVRHDDYTNSGFDRGHLVRSEERTLNEDDNISTFYTTNILPMTPDLNRGPWLDIEYYVEGAAKNNPNLKMQVYAGGIFTTDSTVKGEGIIPYPDTLWKAFIIYDSNPDRENLGIVEAHAYKFPNIDGISKEEPGQYRVTIDDLEASTGYDLFFSIHDSLEIIIEADSDFKMAL